MSATAIAVILGAFVVLLIKTRWLRLSGAIVCVAFGLVLASGPMGPALNAVLDGVGEWTYAQLRAL